MTHRACFPLISSLSNLKMKGKYEMPSHKKIFSSPSCENSQGSKIRRLYAIKSFLLKPICGKTVLWLHSTKSLGHSTLFWKLPAKTCIQIIIGKKKDENTALFLSFYSYPLPTPPFPLFSKITLTCTVPKLFVL